MINPIFTPRPTIPPIVGRFAPSPTGQLHLGSLITAVASYCAVRQQGGTWLVRMEDTDTDRCKQAFADSILADLERLGLHWDGEVRYQTQHIADYQQAIIVLKQKNLVYGCDCSRKQIELFYQSQGYETQANSSETPLPYPRLCLSKNLSLNNKAVRLLLPDVLMGFFDKLQGTQWQNPQASDGDIVLRRRDGMINYMLSVVVDDGLQGVNHIVRGLDILPLTLSQMLLTKYLNLPNSHSYFHLPILVNDKGQKLSKQTLAEPICNYSASDLLAIAFGLLQQKVEKDTPDRMLAQGVSEWDFTPLIGKKTIQVPDKIGDFLS